MILLNNKFMEDFKSICTHETVGYNRVIYKMQIGRKFANIKKNKI